MATKAGAAAETAEMAEMERLRAEKEFGQAVEEERRRIAAEPADIRRWMRSATHWVARPHPLPPSPSASEQDAALISVIMEEVEQEAAAAEVQCGEQRGRVLRRAAEEAERAREQAFAEQIKQLLLARAARVMVQREALEGMREEARTRSRTRSQQSEKKKVAAAERKARAAAAQVAAEEGWEKLTGGVELFVKQGRFLPPKQARKKQTGNSSARSVRAEAKLIASAFVAEVDSIMQQ